MQCNEAIVYDLWQQSANDAMAKVRKSTSITDGGMDRLLLNPEEGY